ncbi:MAG: peptide ABC transporter substrate-binding protein [Candidatus Latescibacteria bacterium]|jgi:ABC-type oligopeptide transport system substrate-binding subunit|nr:peptide ABC transporter substrate-binding protein [Candidatus Latescibacterota bacterium]MDP7235427.1 peptide ABC transporter substrate-binding protein [Candidatus Latescibacterota bacterium]
MTCKHVSFLGIVACSLFGMTVVLNAEQNGLVNRVGKRLPADAAPLERQVYRYMAREPETLDVSVALGRAENSEFLFERLLLFDQNNDLIPGAAERWEVSEDGLTWTFHIRPDSRWSDGRPVTARDFEYTFRRLLDPSVGNRLAFLYYDIKGAQAYNTGGNTPVVNLGVRAVDDLTFQIMTEKPSPFIPYLAAFQGSSPVPAWQVEKYGRRWTDAGNCVSNSSYLLVDWRAGDRITFELNPGYSGPNKGFVERMVEIFTVPGSAQAVLAYENNEIDRTSVTVEDIDRIRRDPVLGQQLNTFPYFATTYLIMQTQQEPFNDVRVRQAFAHAIDREALCRVVHRGMHQPAYSMLPSGFSASAGDKYKSAQVYNPSRARRLLQEAGYPEGRGFPHVEFFITGKTSREVQAIQNMIKQVLNVDIDIGTLESRTLGERMYNYEAPMTLLSWWFDYPDPHNMLTAPWRTRPKGFGRQDWLHPAFNDYVDRAAHELDPEKRLAMYDRAERILSEEVGGIFLYHRYAFDLRKPWLKGIKKDRMGYYPYLEHNSNVWFDLYIGATD